MKEKNIKSSLIKILAIGSFYFVVTVVALTQWVPDMKEMEPNLLSEYFVVAIIFMMLFSLFSIIFSLKASAMLKRKNDLSQKYIQITRICFVIFLIIFPLILFVNQSHMYNKMFS